MKIWVNGIQWKEVPYFYKRDSFEQIYIVRQNDKNETIITFGDGKIGARLPTGKNNVIASYRFGAGSAHPPANSITQLVKPVKASFVAKISFK